MRDTIYREDAIEAIKDNSFALGDDYMEINGYGAIDDIRALPSADRPRGEWIDMGDFEQCSVCKGTRLKEFQSYYGKVTWIKTPYCPSCGAKMKGADDE